MTLADDPTIGVVPGPAERDPDLAPLIIDLSGRNRLAPSSLDPAAEVTARIPLPLAEPPAVRRDAPIGMPASRTRPSPPRPTAADEPATEPIRAITVEPTEPTRAITIGPTEPTRAITIEPTALAGAITDEPSEPAGATTDEPTAPIRATTIEPTAPAGATTDEPTAPIRAATDVAATGAVELTTTAATKPAKPVRARARVYPRRLRRTGTVADHRRRWDRSSLRRWEAVAWIAAAGLVAAMAGFVVRSAPLVGRLTHPSAPAGASAAAAGPSGQDCVLQACARSYPPGPPTRVRIPAIHVDSPLESLSLDATGALNPPDRYDEAGWYAGGVVPGNDGPAVIAGHVDSTAGPAVFFYLRTLVPGAVVSVDRGGAWINFRVTQIEEYPKDKFPAAKVYQATPDPELRVITCGGDFDTVHKRYYDDVVVYAILA